MTNDRNHNELIPGDVCTWHGQPGDLTCEVPDDYEGDPCTVHSLKSGSEIRVLFEGDPDRYIVSSRCVTLHHRPKSKADAAPKPKNEPNPTSKPDEKAADDQGKA